MKNFRILAIALVMMGAMMVVSCGSKTPDPTGGDTTVTTANPFAEIGTVVPKPIASTNDDTTAITTAVAGLTLESNEIAIVIDCSDSLNKMSDWTSHKPFLVGDFGAFVLGDGTTTLASWGFDPATDGNDDMTAAATDVYTIVIELIEDTAAWTNIWVDGGSMTLAMKPANYLNTDAGTNALNPVDFWNSIGTFGGTENVEWTLTNDGGTLTVLAVSYKAAVPAASVATGQTAGIKINGAFNEWSLQTAGLDDVLAVGTKVRIIWENLPTGTPYSSPSAAVTNVWTDFPADAVVTGGAAWLHTDGTSTWDPTLGNAVLVDTVNNKAVVTCTLAAESSISFEFKMANVAGWDNGEEANNHAAMVPAGSTEYTVYVDADFNLLP